MPDEKQIIARFDYRSKKGFIDADKTKIFPISTTLEKVVAKGKSMAPKEGSLNRISLDFED